MEIIPAIDIIDGKCVRLAQGDYAHKKIYSEFPLDVAKSFEDEGLRRLHLVDLDGAKAGAVVNWNVLETLASKTSLTIDFGGGIKKEEDVKTVFECGASFVAIGSMAVKDKETFLIWLKDYGAENFLLGADVKDEKIAVSGWSETSSVNIFDFVEMYMQHGIQHVFCTDISKDGMLLGPSIALYKNIIQKFPSLHFIASGGVTSVNDLEQLKVIGCKGVIIGKAIYEGRINLSALKKFTDNNSLSI